MPKNRRKITLWQAYARHSLRVAMPVAGANLASVLSTFFGVLLLARLGKDVLAASALISSMQIFLTVITSSVMFSMSVVVGNHHGRKQYEEIGGIVQQGWLLCLLLTLPTAAICWNSKALFIALGQKPALAQIVQDYFRPFIVAIPATLLQVANRQMIVGVLKQRYVLMCTILGLCVLMISALVLMFGFLGLPALGVPGLAYAIAIQAWFMVGFYLLIYQLDHSFDRYKIFSHHPFQAGKYLRRLFSIGWPISAQIGSELLAMLFVMVMVGWLGSTQLAARQIVGQYLILVIVPIFGISQANAVLVSQALGANKIKRLPLIAASNLTLALLVMGSVAAVFMSVPKALAALYINIHAPQNAAILKLVSILFIIYSFSQIFDTMRNVTGGALRGMYDTKYPMYIGVFAIWVIAVPVGYSLGFPLKMGVVGLALGNLTGVFIGAILVLRRWRKNSQFEQLKLQPLRHH